MILLEYIYFVSLGAIALLLIVFRLARVVTSWATTRHAWLGHHTIRGIFLSYLVYQRLGERLLGSDAPSPLATLLSGGFFAGTCAVNLISVGSLSEASTRAARLSLMSLFPHFLSGGREFGARILGISLETYGIIHRLTGLMSVLQATIHVVIVTRSIKFNSSQEIHFYGLVAGCMLLSLLFLPMVKRRVYEVFLKVHLAAAIVAIYSIWKHIRSISGHLKWCPAIYLGIFLATGVINTLQIFFRNFVLGRKSVRMTVQLFPENIAHVRLELPRPWVVRAGERVNLGAPSIGLFYIFQAHPFMITWWEEDTDGEAATIFLMFRTRAGFTRKVVDCTDPNLQYRAWIDGPFGPTIVHGGPNCRDIGDYGHVLMATSGIGIAAQIPYIKEMLQKRRSAEVRTQKITLIWQLDRTGDWESGRQWLQELVKLDTYYILNITVYDPNDPAEESEKIGAHGLITFTGGEVNWDEVFASEMKDQKGNLLVTVSARHHIRQLIQKLVRKNIQHNVELFELEFQPWREGRDWLSFFTP